MCPSQESATAMYPGYEVRGSGTWAIVCAVSKIVHLYAMKDNAENALKLGCKHGAIHELIFIPLPPAPARDVYGFDSRA